MTFLKRRVAHLTPRYIVNRLTVMVDERLHPTHPWLTRDAVKILSSLIKPSDVGVEFGSGRSTKWFAQRLSHLTSIENNELWYEKVVHELNRAGLSGKVDYRLRKDDDDYVEQAQSFLDDSVDFCLVDGAVRDRCALLMLSKIRRGGGMVVDNVNWYLPNDFTFSPDSRRTSDGCANDAWQQFAGAVKSWRVIWTSNGVTDTAIWIKS